MSGTLGAPIARGRTAEVYAWQPGWVLKLYREGWSRGSAEWEAHIARAVHASGVASPAAGDVVEVEGRFGLPYERVTGPTMLSAVLSRPWTLGRSARLLAELHAQMHGSRTRELPSQREKLQRRIRSAPELTDAVRGAVLDLLERLPDGDSVCHGDFHPENVLLSESGPVVIDWVDATRGHPLADVARTSLLMRGSLPPGIRLRSLLQLLGRRYHSTYLRRYSELRDMDARELALWEPVVAAARLSEGIPEETDRLLALVEAGVRSV